MSAVVGMDAQTGLPLGGVDHVRQSLRRIVTTRLGTRIQRRGFGTDLFALLAAPASAATRIRAVTLIAKAVLRDEPRVRVSHVQFYASADGHTVIELACDYEGQDIRTSVPLSMTGGAL